MAYMRQQGLGEYDQVGDWGWEFYPPPYDFLAARDAKRMPAPVIYTPLARSGPAGLGCGSCGGACGGGCSHGLGQGLFESGLDLSQWSVGEWLVAGSVAFVAWKVLFGAARGVSSVRKTYRKAKSKTRRRRELEQEMAEL
jgi:hypothetical protein